MYLNLYSLRIPVPEVVRGYYVRFEKLTMKEQSERRRILQGITRRLNNMGYDASVVTQDLFDQYDIVILNIRRDRILKIISNYNDLRPKIEEVEINRKEILKEAWENKVREYLRKNGFLKIGDRYVSKEDIRKNKDCYKMSYEVQAVFIDAFPSLFIDPRAKIMIPLEKEKIDVASSLRDELRKQIKKGEIDPSNPRLNDIRVRILPKWTVGILLGRTGKKADNEFDIDGENCKMTDYWKEKYDIDFVKPDDEVATVENSNAKGYNLD